jgi:N-acetylglucosaminyl-diphospho-decaprenol L-rhamnosyltransferase
MRPVVYIPNFNGAEHLPKALASLRAQSRTVDVVVADNQSSDHSVALVREDFPEVTVLEMGGNLGFGRAVNRAVELHPSDLVILLNADAVAEPRFVEALLDHLAEDVEMVAGVLMQEAAPELIDSAGIVADRTLMGFDYLHGEPAERLAGAADPLGPTGGAGLYRRRALDAVGGFDERIFLYYEDLDLALRIAAHGGRTRLAGEARALHAYSASLGAASARKYEATGWTRGYMLRRYGVLGDRRTAARVLATEGALCLGQVLKDHTTAGLRGRLRGWREGSGAERSDISGAPLLDLGAHEALALRRRRRG